MKLIKISLSAILFVFLTGCASLLPSVLPEPASAGTVYRLSTAKQSAPQAPNAFVVRIDRPSVSNVFETTDIIVSPDGRRLASASGAEWAEVIPVMIQNSFVDVLGQHPNLVGVIPSSGARTDTRIHLTVKSFEAQFDQGDGSAPLAVVHYAATLSNASNRNLLGSFDVRRTVRASEARVSSIVQAMDTANQQALEEIAQWLEQPINRS